MRVLWVIAATALVVACGSGVATSSDAGGGGDGSSGGDASGDSGGGGDAGGDSGSGGDAGGDASQGGDAGNGSACDPKNDTCQRPLKCCPGGAVNTYFCQPTDPNGNCIPKP
jgi:hypothetical protein